MNWKKKLKQYAKVALGSFIVQFSIQMRYYEDGFEEAVLLGLGFVCSELIALRVSLADDEV